MLTMIKTAVLGSGLALGLLLVGCQSSGTKTTDHKMTADAVQCDKCQVTWVNTTNTAKGRVIGYTSTKKMECPECRDAVSNFFATGNLKHDCTACGGNMSICDAH